jgi:hypothetical protein
MANAIFCNDGLTEETINFNGQSIPLGSFITATDQTPAPDVVNYCFQITGEDEISGTLSATSETYSSCYDCLANNYTIISIGSCDGSIEGSLPITAFGFIPELEQVIYAEINILTINGFSAYTTCFKINEIIQTSEDEYVSVYEPEFSIIEQIIHNNFSIENGCNECLNGFSAGTESEACQICWDGSGYTATVVSAPHPRWTNQFGQTVIQLDAITLGGQNGLNN